MTDWHSCALGDAVELAYGKSLPKDGRIQTGSVPVYGSNGITGWHDVAIVNQPTVIVGRKGSAGAVQYVDQPCYPIDTTYFVRARAGFQFDSKFLFYLLKRLDLSRLKTATGVPGLTREDAYRESIRFPPIEEQRRIVDLLSRAENIVRLRREAQQKAVELAPAIFLEMFGDPAINPKHWPLATIESICAVKTGATPLRERKEFYENGTVPWVKTGEVKNGEIFDAEERITELAVSSTNCKVFPVNTILVAMYGQGQTRGRCGILKVPASTNQACVAILPSQHIRHVFLFELIRLQYERLRAMGRGGNQANLNMGMIKAFEVPIPPEYLQLEFERRIQFVSSILRQQFAATVASQAVFNSLLGSQFAK